MTVGRFMLRGQTPLCALPESRKLINSPSDQRQKKMPLAKNYIFIIAKKTFLKKQLV